MKEETREPGKPIFRYNREERLASLPDHIANRGSGGKRGILRGNRSLLITIIDVVFLILLVVVFSVIARFRGDTAVLPGYTISAQATEYGNQVLISIKAEKRKDPGEETHVRIALSYPEEPDRVELDGFLPSKIGEETFFRGVLPVSRTARRVRIEMFTEDASGTILSKIRSE